MAFVMLMLAGASFDVHNLLPSSDRAFAVACFRWFMEHKHQFAEDMAEHMTQADLESHRHGSFKHCATKRTRRCWSADDVLRDFRSPNELDSKMKWAAFHTVFNPHFGEFVCTFTTSQGSGAYS